MAVRVHTYNAAGKLVDTSLANPDDDGAPSLPPGTRIHTVAGMGDIAQSSSSPDETEIVARRAKQKAVDPPRMTVKRKATKAREEPMSDRRRCLELAASRGGSPQEIIAAARAFADFLEGKD